MKLEKWRNVQAFESCWRSRNWPFGKHCWWAKNEYFLTARGWLLVLAVTVKSFAKLHSCKPRDWWATSWQPLLRGYNLLVSGYWRLLVWKIHLWYCTETLFAILLITRSLLLLPVVCMEDGDFSANGSQCSRENLEWITQMETETHF